MKLLLLILSAYSIWITFAALSLLRQHRILRQGIRDLRATVDALLLQHAESIDEMLEIVNRRL